MSAVLYIDLGNSRLKWLYDQEGGISSMQALEYVDNKLQEQLSALWNTDAKPEQVWIASVASAVAFAQLIKWVEAHWHVIPRIMKVSEMACGLRCAYQQPQQLGVDRWAALIAAYAHYPHGACVVDCGTAVTLDVVNGEGQHLGGFILPGVGTMEQALLQRTAIQPNTGVEGLSQEWGNDTDSCIALGTRKAIVALIEQSIERMQAGGICDPGLLVTGGEVELIEPLIQIDYQRRDALVLEGMKIYAQERN
jgi:type III pantothenate kinase